MGLFDRFRSSNTSGAPNKGAEKKDAGKPSPVTKWAETCGDKRAANYDRQEAIGELEILAGPPTTPDPGRAEEQDRIRTEASLALLKRFTFTVDPSILDQEEKESAFRAVLKAGKLAVPAIRTFAVKAESLSWAMRVLRELQDEEELIGELVTLLARWDTEYSKFIDAKIQLLVELENHQDPRVLEAVGRFLEDVNETARFHAVAATLAQDNEAAIPALLTALEVEESFRVKNKILDGMASRKWTVPEDDRERIRKAMPAGFSIDGAGTVTKRAS